MGLNATLETGALMRALAAVLLARGPRITLPVLNNVKLDATTDALTLTCTNLEVAVSVRVPATVRRAGAVTVPAKLFASLVRGLPGERVHMRQTGDRLVFAGCGSGAIATLGGIDADEFPPVPAIPDRVASLHTNVATLRRVIALTGYAAAQDESRPVLAGFNLVAKAGDKKPFARGVSAAAADGFRLSAFDGWCQAGQLDHDFDVIVPVACIKTLDKALRQLPRKLADADVLGWVDTVAPTRITWQLPALDGGPGPLVTSRLLEGAYPNLRRAVPAMENAAIRVTCDADALLGAVRQAGIVAQDAANLITLGMHKGRFTVSAACGDEIRWRSGVPAAVDVTAENFTIGFAAPYLVDYLTRLRGGQVQIGFTGQLSPALFLAPDVPGYAHVMMPMHTVK